MYEDAVRQRAFAEVRHDDVEPAGAALHPQPVSALDLRGIARLC